MAQSEHGQKERKVLIAVDGSDNSEDAFQVYAQAVHRRGDLVLIVFVQEDKPYEPWPKSSNYHDDWVSIVKYLKEQEDFMVNEYETKCKKYGFDFEPLMVETGKPGEVICSLAKDEEVALVVVGSRGKGTIRRTLMGSVSAHCVHHAHVPVLVVPHADRHRLHGCDNERNPGPRH